MDGSISRVRIGDGTFRYRARYRDPSGRQHERRFPRKVDAQRWLDEATSALVTRTWTAPERGRVTVAEWAERWLAARMDAAARAAAEARVGAVWARPLTERSEKGKTAAQKGGPRGDRTLNPRIKSPLLCRLS